MAKAISALRFAVNIRTLKEKAKSAEFDGSVPVGEKGFQESRRPGRWGRAAAAYLTNREGAYYGPGSVR